MVPCDISAASLLQAGVTKHGKHFQQFNTSLEYVLLYPDNTLVSNLPGSSEGFSLFKYKDDLGKPYSKIYFWLCERSDYDATKTEVIESDTSDDENPLPKFGGNKEEQDEVILPILQSTATAQPSNCVTIAAHTSGSDVTNIEEASTLCPTCYKNFLISIIEAHADLCADAFDPVGEISGCSDYLELFSGDDMMSMYSRDSPLTIPEKDQVMREFIHELQKKLKLNQRHELTSGGRESSMITWQ